jgi:hypothetical protein
MRHIGRLEPGVWMMLWTARGMLRIDLCVKLWITR